MSRTARRLIATVVAVAGLALSCCAVAGLSMAADDRADRRDARYAEAQVGG